MQVLGHLALCSLKRTIHGNFNIIAYARRSLTPVEQRYSQTERKASAYSTKSILFNQTTVRSNYYRRIHFNVLQLGSNDGISINTIFQSNIDQEKTTQRIICLDILSMVKMKLTPQVRQATCESYCRISHPFCYHNSRNKQSPYR